MDSNAAGILDLDLPKLELETPECNLCGGKDADHVFSGKDRLHQLEGEFAFLRCRKCGLIYLSPRPTKESIGRYYPDDYIAYSKIHRQKLSPFTNWDRRYGMSKRAGEVETYKPSGRVLDVGCATGNFLAYMKNRGWEAWGVEVNDTAAEIARERSLTVVSKQLVDAGFPDKHFDAITFWDVVEHLHDPMQNLLEVHRLLKDDGILVFGVPNARSLEAKIFGEHWAGLDVPRHLYVFPLPALKKMLWAAGFSTIRMRCLYGTFGSHKLSLQFLLDAKLGEGRLKKLIQFLATSIVVRGLSVPYFRIVDQLLRGSNLTVVARKSAND